MRCAEYDAYWQEHQAAALAKRLEPPWNITKKNTDVWADPCRVLLNRRQDFKV
jgi:hypothetical protein